MKVNGNENVNAVRSPIARAQEWTTKSGGALLGDLVAWDFGDGAQQFSQPRAAVRALFERHGFEDCVDSEDLDVGKSLLTAASGGHGVKFGRGVIVRPFERPNRDTPVAVGIYQQREGSGERGDEFEPLARVRIECSPMTGGISAAVAMPPEGAVGYADPRWQRVALDLADKANELATRVTNNELSDALCRAGRQTMWASYRRKLGGTWFVYAENCERFRALLAELEQLGGFYPTIQPVFVDGDGLSERNVERASKGALEAELERLQKDLARAQAEGNMREKTVQARMSECDDLIARADLYKRLLREASDQIGAKVAAVKASFQRVLDGHDEVFDAVVASVRAEEPRKAQAQRWEPEADEDAFAL